MDNLDKMMNAVILPEPGSALRHDAENRYSGKSLDVLMSEVDSCRSDRLINSREVRKSSVNLLHRSEDMVRESFGSADLSHPLMRELYRLNILSVARKMVSGRISENYSAKSMEKVQVESISAESARELIQKEIDDASIPEVYVHIMQALNAPYGNASSLAHAIGRDPAFAATLLRLANSPFYGFGGRVDTIQRAVTFVGYDELSALALSISALRYFRAVPEEFTDLTGFWRKAIACGAFCKILARMAGINGGWFFVAGLLHDIGRLATFRVVPGLAASAEKRAIKLGLDQHQVEQELMGIDTAHAGAMLLEHWDFPTQLTDMVRHRNDPMGAEFSRQASVLHVAGLLTSAMSVGESGEGIIPDLAPGAWESLGLSITVLPGIMHDAEHEMDGILRTFLRV